MYEVLDGDDGDDGDVVKVSSFIIWSPCDSVGVDGKDGCTLLF